MEFNIKNLWILNIGGVEVWITQTIVNTWAIMAVLIIFAIIARIKLRKLSDIPTGFQNVMEAAIETLNGFVKAAAGEKLVFLGNWFFMVFLFMLTSNFSGLFGLRPPTADWATTFALGLWTLILIIAMGAKYRKMEYLKSFFEPIPIFLPLNLIGELSRPVSLSFRLFGNVLAGMIIMALVYLLLPGVLQIGLPVALHVFFDVIFGALQTYIFCVLSLSFIGATAEIPEK